MANRPPKTAKNPRTASVRGFLNLAVTAPDLGAVVQKDLGTYDGGKALSFGTGNIVPVMAMAAAQQSGTAYRCLERRAQLLEGEGFPVPKRNELTGAYLVDTEVGTMGETAVPGHPGKTANDLWAELCSYGAYLNGDAVLVRYLGEEGGYAIGEIHVLPFGSVRKTTSGTYLLNHKFGRKGFKQGDTTEHLPFNPDPAHVKAQMEADMRAAEDKGKPYSQAGQILYIYTPKAGEEDYPLPPHWPGLEAVLADAAYARYELDEVEGGFTAKGILAMVGEPDYGTPDENGETQVDREDSELGLFTNQGARQQGQRRKSIMVVDVANKDVVPVWVPMGTTVGLKWLSDKKEAIGQEVCRHIGIPPILAGFARVGQLGVTQEIINATQLTQNSLESLRKLLLRAFWRLMPSLSGVVPGKLNPVVLATEINPLP
jgi:hypothetical protein